MNEGSSDHHHDHDHDHDYERVHDDDSPRRGRVVLMAVLVPVVGAAGGAAGPLFRGTTSAGGPLLVLTGVVAFLAAFALFSLSAIWLLNKASLAVAHVRAHRGHRDRRAR
ncbi:hypothetical protein [Streptomyces sp. NPDC000229]|uniref:hypothetical protein n=1 Tax=Streptomyces sp. NPDC000229 TaxID=3154247 RepID=UPI00333086E6